MIPAAVSQQVQGKNIVTNAERKAAQDTWKIYEKILQKFCIGIDPRGTKEKDRKNQKVESDGF